MLAFGTGCSTGPWSVPDVIIAQIYEGPTLQRDGHEKFVGVCRGALLNDETYCTAEVPAASRRSATSREVLSRHTGRKSPWAVA